MCCQARALLSLLARCVCLYSSQLRLSKFTVNVLSSLRTRMIRTVRSVAVCKRSVSVCECGCERLSVWQRHNADDRLEYMVSCLATATQAAGLMMYRFRTFLICAYMRHICIPSICIRSAICDRITCEI